MRNVRLNIILLLVCNVLSFAELVVVKGGNAFLELGGSARGEALAGALTAVPFDYSAGIYNPAALVGIKSTALTLTYDKLFGGMQSQNLFTYALPFDSAHAAGIHFIRSSVDGIINTSNLETDATGRPIHNVDLLSEIENSDMAFAFSYAGSAYSGFLRYGGTVKFLRRAFGEHTGYGAGFDGGIQLHSRSGFIAGFFAKNLGTTIVRYSPEAYELSPPEIYAGISFVRSSEYFYGTFMLIYETPNMVEVPDGFGAVAFEYAIKRQVFVRVGANDDYLLTAGTGIQMGRFAADVAFRVHQGFPLSTRFSVGMNL